MAVLTPSSRARAVPSARGSSTRFVVGVVVVAVLVRLAYLTSPLSPDEAGYLLVARDWHLGGPNLYGHYWVDRPPGLIAIFKLASLFGWDQAVRVIALPFVALFVAGAAWAAHLVAGPRAARWSAVVAAALAVSPSLDAHSADGELFAVPLVMLAVALTLAATRWTGPAVAGLAFGAGLSAGLAVVVKQNFFDGIVFAVALLVSSLVQRRMPPRFAARIAVAGVAGGSVVLLAAAGYAHVSGVGVGSLWYDVFSFRSVALDVIEDHSLNAPVHRGLALAGLSVISGIAPVLVVLARGAWRCRLSGPPLAWAIGVTVGTGVVGIAAGGSYWPHYLLQLAPMVTLAVGLWGAHSWWLRAAAVLAVVSALLSTVVFVASDGISHVHQRAHVVGGWLGASARPGDTATVLYGSADVQEASGLRSPYPYLWTLPMRTLDPELTRLHALVTGPRAPTWLVEWSDLDAWDIDPHGRLRLDVATHYRLVRRVCGHDVWLHDGVRRSLAPAPVC